MLFCGHLRAAFKKFVERRGILLLVCTGWEALIRGSSDFWNGFKFAPFLPIEELRTWRINVGPFASLDLDLTFLSYGGPPSQLLDTPRATLRQIIGFASTCVPRCRTMLINAEDIYALPILISLFANVSATILETLTIIRVPASAVVRSLADFSASPHIFTGHIPTLRILRLSCFVLSWTNFGAYSSLTVLVLHDIFGTMAPTVEVLVAVLNASPILRCVSLRRVHCLKGPDTSRPSWLYLNCVQEFDVRFDSDPGLASVVCRLVMPVIKLSVTFDSSKDVMYLARCTQLLSSVDTFVAQGGACDTSAAMEIFQKLLAVRNVDLSHSDRVLFDALSACRGNAVPIMQSLTVSDVTLENVVDYIQDREWTESKLDVLRVHNFEECGETPVVDLGWVRMKVGVLDVEPKVWPTFDPAWVVDVM